MPMKSLTAAAVERLKAPKSGQADYFDQGYPGLSLRISYGGRKAWSMHYRLHGKLHRMSSGDLPRHEPCRGQGSMAGDSKTGCQWNRPVRRKGLGPPLHSLRRCR